MPKIGTAYVSIRAKLDRLEKDLQDSKRLIEKSAMATQKSVSNIFKATLGYFVGLQVKGAPEVTRLDVNRQWRRLYRIGGPCGVFEREIGSLNFSVVGQGCCIEVQYGPADPSLPVGADDKAVGGADGLPTAVQTRFDRSGFFPVVVKDSRQALFLCYFEKGAFDGFEVPLRVQTPPFK